MRRAVNDNLGLLGWLLALLVGTLFAVLYIVNLSPYSYRSGGDSPVYVRAEVISASSPVLMKNSSQMGQQTIVAKIVDGPDKGQRVEVKRTVAVSDSRLVDMPVGSKLLLSQSVGQKNYNYINRYHIPGLAFLFGVVLLLIAVVGRWRGLTGLVGLLAGLCVLFVFVIPRILDGHDPYIACSQGAFMIAVVSVFIAHGFNKRAAIALMSTTAILLLVVGGVTVATYLVGFVGYAGSEANGLLYADKPISVYGLIAGGMLIAVLGVLDDITTGQSAVVDELYKTNPKLSTRVLYFKGLSVGGEHVASLVNTLALVYVGVSLPTIVLTQLYFDGPLLVLLNYEVITEEILRTLITSASLLIAVPVSTILAAYILPRWYKVSG